MKLSEYMTQHHLKTRGELLALFNDNKDKGLLPIHFYICPECKEILPCSAVKRRCGHGGKAERIPPK